MAKKKNGKRKSNGKHLSIMGVKAAAAGVQYLNVGEAVQAAQAGDWEFALTALAREDPQKRQDFMQAAGKKIIGSRIFGRCQVASIGGHDVTIF